MKTKTRKILAVIILATMVLTMIPIINVFAEADIKPRFNISQNIIMKRDETSTLDVTVNEKLEFVRFNTILDYDADAIEIIGIEKGRILPNEAQLDINYGTDGKINGFAIDYSEKMSIDAGTIAEVEVKTKDNANLGKYPIEWVHANLLSDDNEEVEITTDPGSIIIAGEGTNDEKPEFSMVYNNKMYPGEEQTVSVKTNDKLEFNFIESQLLYDDNMEIVNITKGKALPNDADVILNHDGILGTINGFSIQGNGVIQIDPNEELVNVTIKASENDTPGKGKFQIDWNNILNPDWDIVKADNTIANIEILPQVTTEVQGIEFTDSRIEMYEGQEFKMQYKLTPENIDPLPKIEWITANKDVATVDDNGIVTAVGVGETTITAKAGDCIATAQIIVTAKTLDIEVPEPPVEPSNGTTESPETGDIQIELFAGMMIISVIGIAYMVTMKKK